MQDGTPATSETTASAGGSAAPLERFLSPEGEQDWFIEGLIDLRGKEDVDGALVQVRHVGR